ncbi:DsbA family protein [Actinokineospora guangxiensis]|uniref:DsbA family protein n=1 Tax=Actinokineospora guangxiensis TaxID=1490288 RepID=A0ABW0EQS6_9PSEU
MTSKNPVKARHGLSLNVVMTIAVVVVAVLVVGGIMLFGGSDTTTGGTGGTGDSGDAAREAGGSGGGVSTAVLAPDGSHELTSAADGKVTIVEFLDYQCPACAGYFANVTSKVEKDYAGKVTFVVRNYPLDSHPLAVPAARAAEAAAEQDKFSEMYHLIYQNYQEWAVAPDGQQLSDDTARAGQVFLGYAERLGLDTAKFTADLDSPAVQARIDKDTADGKTAGVSGTPTIFVNGQKFEATGDTFADVDRQLRELVDRELAG